MAPLEVVFEAAGACCVVTWGASLITGDTSWVDRLWSIVPIAYVGIFAGFAHWRNVRLDVMASLVAVWGIRLTFNLARKGGYRGVEDYRWAVLRARMSHWQFQLFNLVFIVLYQNAILVLIALPALTAYEHRSTPFGIIDGILALLFVLCTVGETVADGQQWHFQTAKSSIIATGQTPVEQFLDGGLFRYSRHPNYFFELAQWWILFFVGVTAARSIVQAAVIGPVLLTSLFVGSTRFTESITLSRYPSYEGYQRRTSAIVPWLRTAKKTDA